VELYSRKTYWDDISEEIKSPKRMHWLGANGKGKSESRKTKSFM